MAEHTRPALAEYLARHYVGLKQRLTRLLGSSDLAGEALHDAWLRLQAADSEEAVRSPTGYVLRVATHLAVDAHRRNSRTLTQEDVTELMDLADPAPGPARTVEARIDMQMLLDRLGQMPARRRDVFVLVHWDGLSQPEVARQLGVSLRTVVSELQHAHRTLAAVMNRDKK